MLNYSDVGARAADIRRNIYIFIYVLCPGLRQRRRTNGANRYDDTRIEPSFFGVPTITLYAD